MPLYQNLGFLNHPFSKTNADEEPNLKNYLLLHHTSMQLSVILQILVQQSF